EDRGVLPIRSGIRADLPPVECVDIERDDVEEETASSEALQQKERRRGQSNGPCGEHPGSPARGLAQQPDEGSEWRCQRIGLSRVDGRDEQRAGGGESERALR